MSFDYFELFIREFALFVYNRAVDLYFAEVVKRGGGGYNENIFRLNIAIVFL